MLGQWLSQPFGGIWRESLGSHVASSCLTWSQFLRSFKKDRYSICVAFLASAFLVGNQNPDPEKNTPFECGFDVFEDTRVNFDVRFYLVAILFIIFDLEIAFLFPWAVSLGNIGLFGFWSMMFFLIVLTFGFIYEWKKGALEWE